MLQQACVPENYEAEFFFISGQKLERFLYKNFIIFIHERPLKSTGQSPQQSLILNLAVL